MRVAFDHQAVCMQSYGGISRYFTRIAEHLIALDIDAHFFSSIHRNFYLDELPKSAVSGKKLNSYPPKSFRLIQEFNRLAGKLAMQRWRPDVVHETYYAKKTSSPRGCPTVLTVYDMIHELFPDSFSSRDNTAHVKRIAIERADHVVCISQNTRDDLVRLLGVPEPKVSVVHLGFEKFLPNLRSSDRRDYSGARPFLLYVGSRVGYKNFSGMLRAISGCSRLIADFDIVAFGGGAFTTSELATIRQLGFKAEQVRQAGGGDSELGILYQSAAAFVYPSVYEGFGLPPLEAMAHSCPVISSNTSSMPEVIGDAGAFFDPLNPEDMAAAIERVVYDSGVIASFQALGHERLTHFSWQRCAAQTLSVYKTLQR